MKFRIILIVFAVLLLIAAWVTRDPYPHYNLKRYVSKQLSQTSYTIVDIFDTWVEGDQSKLDEFEKSIASESGKLYYSSKSGDREIIYIFQCLSEQYFAIKNAGSITFYRMVEVKP